MDLNVKIIIILITSFFLYNCLSDDNKNCFSLEKLYPQKIGYKWLYFGTMDYGKEEELIEIKHNNDEITLIIKGKIEDLSGGLANNNSYKDIYIINKNKIIKNNDILLECPLIKNNNWKSIIRINNKDYSAETSIKEIKKDLIFTEAFIKGLENYKNNLYYEINIFEIGKGLIYKRYSMEKDVGFDMEIFLEDDKIDPDNIHEMVESIFFND